MVRHPAFYLVAVAFHLVVCLVFVIAHVVVYPVLGFVHFALMALSEP